MKLVGLPDIRAAIDIAEATAMIERGFVDYSAGRAVVPPVGHLGFADPPGDCHIKYGYIEGDEFFVIKIATGFYRNPSLNLPSSNGCILLLSASTGAPLALLDDEGYLTDLRTAIAGLVAAKYLAPKEIRAIGVVGTGTQARLQSRLLCSLYPGRPIVAWGRSADGLARFAADMAESGIDVRPQEDLRALCETANLIVTTTPATEPLIEKQWILPGTHITAVGADAPGKRELAPELVAAVDLCVVDSRTQCIDHGEVAAAVAGGALAADALIELGEVIAAPARGRSRTEQTTLADLTGVAVQDIQIAKHVWLRQSAC